MTIDPHPPREIIHVSEFDYELPQELIAQQPIEPRDASRLLVVDRKEGTIEHRRFSDLPEYLAPQDVLVLNDTRVIPARLLGKKKTGGAVEVLLLKRLGDGLWEALVKPSRRLAEGTEVVFSEHLRAVMGGWVGDGTRYITLHPEGDESEVLHRVGELPLPPYIEHRLTDGDRYQTIFSANEGSAAAPTAGLHFTPQLFERLKAGAVDVQYVTLHVGVGTFRPVMTEHVHEHIMHKEWYEVPPKTAEVVNARKQAGRRVVAVGTTTCRTLESAVTGDFQIQSGANETDLFIYPGYKFNVVDALITNFHLPRSSLLMLVAAFAGERLMKKAYEEAIREKYRFYSFGDAMLIV